MEKCLSSERGVLGLGALSYYSRSEFRKISKHIINKIPSLINESNIDNFRMKCLELVNFLIQHKKAPLYENQNKWEGTIKYWATSYFKLIAKKHGGCFPILDNNEKNILELNYEALDFCEKKNNKISEIQCLTGRRKILGECDKTCSNKINEYNVWINNEKVNFNNKKELLKHNCKNPPSQFPTEKCNILKSNIFSTLNECRDKNSATISPSTSKEEKTPLQVVGQNIVNSPPNDKVPTKEVMQDSLEGPTQTKEETTEDQEKPPVSQPVTQVSTSDATSSSQSTSAQIQNIQSEPDTTSKASSQPENEASLSPGSNILQNSVSQITMAPSSTETISSHSGTSLPSSTSANSNGPLKILDSEKHTAITNKYTILISFLCVIVFFLFIKYALIEMFKKKKKTRRRHMKFLRLLVPSFSSNKSELFTDYRLEHPIYDDEEFIKKIKINELTKNVYLSKRKKDRSRTIIEVHMEVLEECRNEDWENNKEAFLKICLDEFTKKDYRTYPNLTYNDLITENIKCSDDITKQNILWNKWIERHRNISEKLKKVHWINNLKNEWKKELAYIQEREELKIKSPNENHKVPFIEIEKDLWKHWISKKGIIIEQYLEQEWIKQLDMDLNIMSDECVKEDTKNYIALINTEELQHKENYEELCKYIKKKLLTKLCILVLMTILEEYKKEVNFDNRESFLDISINEWKTQKYSRNKQEITENTTEYINSDIENKRNKEFHTHIRKDSFRNEIEDWIGEDDLYARSIVNNGTVEKSIDIAEKHIS
ncbi:STP1 protein [Plasmodium malariae]|uniref:STP1 protein n=1 Tax=Plasmodium malariae TaxID=5858 RepID=A0A1D3TDJ4_PLAMA|nr:STP1 protein [Plasmodium malariae]SCP02973.1 STP1 protein [Plasmodium malariae]